MVIALKDNLGRLPPPPDVSLSEQVIELRAEVELLRRELSLMVGVVERAKQVMIDARRVGVHDAQTIGDLAPIVSAVAINFNVGILEIRSRRRTGRIARARQAVCYILATRSAMCHTEIGRFLSRDRSTVAHATETVAALLDRDSKLYDADFARRYNDTVAALKKDGVLFGGDSV